MKNYKFQKEGRHSGKERSVKSRYYILDAWLKQDSWAQSPAFHGLLSSTPLGYLPRLIKDNENSGVYRQ